MATLEELVNTTRRRLGRPDRESVPDDAILLGLHNANQLYVIKLRNASDEGALVKRFALAITGGAGDEYPISSLATDFSGASLVTTDPDLYPSGSIREIQVVRQQDLDLVDDGSVSLASGVNSDGVSAMAFFADENGWKCEVRPRGAVGNYRVHYEPASVLQLPLSASPQTPAAFHDLLSIEAALECLPFAMWPGLDPKRAEIQRAGLERMFTRQQMLRMREWEIFVRDMTPEDTGPRAVFESSPGVWDAFRGGGY